MALDIVIPANNAESLIGACLESMMPQLDTTAGDRIVVVDDASSDETARIAAARGAQVVRVGEPVGPYEARNLGATQSSAEFLIFADVRSRALPGWLSSHRTQLHEEGTALSCTNVQVLSGSGYAERVSAIVNMFDLSNYLNRPGQLDYFPTCNLGVRRSAYASVHGFRKIRSGGDADFCWRIQRSGVGRLAADQRVLMLWKPRSTVRGLIEQSFRYGRGHSALQRQSPLVDPVGQREPSPNGAAGLVPEDRMARLRSRLAGNRDDVPAVLGSYALVIPSALGRALAMTSRAPMSSLR